MGGHTPHSVYCVRSMMYKYLCFSALLQSSLVSTINFRLCFVNPPNFYRITRKAHIYEICAVFAWWPGTGVISRLNIKIDTIPCISPNLCTRRLSGPGAFQLKLSKMFPLFWFFYSASANLAQIITQLPYRLIFFFWLGETFIGR